MDDLYVGVPVFFSGGCLYSSSPLYRYKANDSQGICAVCTLSLVVAPRLVGSGGLLYKYFVSAWYSYTKMNTQQIKKERSNEHVCESEDCVMTSVFHM